MTDRTFRERREKVEFREALREFAESKTDTFALARYEESVADELARGYWQDVRDGLFDDDSFDDDRWGSDEDDYEDWYDDGLDDFADERDERRSVFDFDEPWDDLGDDHPTHPGNHIRNGDGRVWLVLDNGRWADMLTGETKRPSSSWVPSEWIVF